MTINAQRRSGHGHGNALCLALNAVRFLSLLSLNTSSEGFFLSQKCVKPFNRAMMSNDLSVM